ncbi:aminotransferase class I/II-fold pyridoxal phosphate-dependent enzyme [Streptomyces sp. NPDC054813]
MQVLPGVLEQIGPVHRFDLADPLTLEARLAEAREQRRTPIALVDGVGSMGGLIDVDSLARSLGEAGGLLYVDDAHGISIDGPYGAGYACEACADGLPGNVVLVGSLSKAFGGAGGFVVLPGEEEVRVLRKFASPLVFGHSIMLPLLAADMAAAKLHLSGEVAGLQERLWGNAALFDELTDGRLVSAGQRSSSAGPISPPSRRRSRRLRSAGVLVLPALFPTVAKGTGLIRFALSALHETSQLTAAVEALGPIAS